MALTSPRFANVPQLARAARNAPWLSSGMRGYGVHLIQVALIDMGIPMPKSVGRAGLSPDWIYGSETVEAVKRFQRSPLGGPPVTDDGAADAQTLAKLDKAMAGYQHRISLEVLTTKPSTTPWSQMLRFAQELYGRYGIKVEVTSGMSVTLTAAEEQVFATYPPFDRR